MERIQEPYVMARSAAVLTALSTVSPLIGLAAEITLAWRFGVSETVDAFRIASLILMFGSQLCYSHLLPHLVIPVLAAYRAKGLEQEGWRIAFSLAAIFGSASLIFVSWVWLYPEALLDLLGPGLRGTSRTNALLLVPYLSWALVLMIGSGVLNSILQVYRIFWLLPTAHLLTNVFVILALLLVGGVWGSGSLALGVLAGSLAVFCCHFYVVSRLINALGIRLLSGLRLGPWDGVVKALRLSVPLFGLLFVGQWSIFVINRVLSEMPPGTLASFGYAWKLLFLVGLLPASLATVIFPVFSDAQVRKDSAQFLQLITKSVKITLLIAVLLSTVLYAIRSPLISLVFARGAMEGDAVTETSRLFGLLLIGAPASALMALLQKVAFSMQDAKSPFITAILSALAITYLVPHAAKIDNMRGIILSINTVQWATTLGLFIYQAWRFHTTSLRDITHYCILLAILCAGALLSLTSLQTIFAFEAAAMTKSTALLQLCVMVLVSVVISYKLAQFLGLPEVTELRHYAWWQCSRIRHWLQLRCSA